MRTRAELDAALVMLPGDYKDPDYVVTHMRGHFGDVFTDADEAKVRELVKAPDAAPTTTDTAPTETPATDQSQEQPAKINGHDVLESNRKYGWHPDQHDPRDLAVEPVVHQHPLPPVIDLRPACPPVVDQGNLGSCTANAIASAIQFERRRQCLPDDFTPSRLFIYFNERKMEGTVEEDAGAAIRDGIKSVAREGVCPEDVWSYDVTKFADRPSSDAYAAAVKHKAVDYWRVPRDITQMRGCLWAGFPFVFGFMVAQTFESEEVARTGVVPLPQPTDENIGGHAVLCVGYDHDRQVFICRNSWGEGWGDKGYFYMPYAYLMDENLATDFWCVKLESE